MHKLLQRDHPLDSPEEDDTLVRREVSAQTGLLPSSHSVAKRSELFLKGTEPKGDSSAWFSKDGKLLLPNEYAGWCAPGGYDSVVFRGDVGAPPAEAQRSPAQTYRCRCGDPGRRAAAPGAHLGAEPDQPLFRGRADPGSVPFCGVRWHLRFYAGPGYDDYGPSQCWRDRSGYGQCF